jgi:Tfp pilus assembly ATPase PilU
MQTLDQCLQKLVNLRKVSREDAAARAVNKDLFR